MTRLAIPATLAAAAVLWWRRRRVVEVRSGARVWRQVREDDAGDLRDRALRTILNPPLPRHPTERAWG